MRRIPLDSICAVLTRDGRKRMKAIEYKHFCRQKEENEDKIIFVLPFVTKKERKNIKGKTHSSFLQTVFLHFRLSSFGFFLQELVFSLSIERRFLQKNDGSFRDFSRFDFSFSFSEKMFFCFCFLPFDSFSF